MEYHGIKLPSRSRRSEPSWPSVIATTLRLWYERHPLAGRKGTRRRHLTLGLALLVVVALAAGVVLAFAGPTASSPPVSSVATQPGGVQPDPAASSALAASATTRTAAAKWIASQVASSAVIACDPAMCVALQAAGLSASSLLVLGTATADPLGSDLIVVTAAVQNEFGARLESVYAPSLIASFGSGSGEIDIRAVAPDGTAAYLSALGADRQARISAGAQLLRNPRLSVAASARQALTAGDVDPRMLILLAALAVQQPLRVTAFGDPSPGAGTAVPLRSVEMTPKGPSAQVGANLRSMLSFIQAQQQPYLPLLAALTGKNALTVEYAAPSPLGLLSGP